MRFKYNHRFPADNPSEMFRHIIIPSNPIIVLCQLHSEGFGAINGHIGFDKLEITDDAALDSHAYAHYLHYKFFEVNYGADGLVPLDKIFGTWHDGTKDADEQMKARFQKKKARLNGKKPARTSAGQDLRFRPLLAASPKPRTIRQ